MVMPTETCNTKADADQSCEIPVNGTEVGEIQVMPPVSPVVPVDPQPNPDVPLPYPVIPPQTESHANTSRILRCTKITKKGELCMQPKDTAHMQLWTDEGYRNLWCSRCKVQARCNRWLCSHDLPWIECIIHRADPDQHRTTRTTQKVRSCAAVPELLDFQRPEPQPKRSKLARKSNASGVVNRKRVVQSAHPHALKYNKDLCPRLAVKFPRLYRTEVPPPDDHMPEVDSSSDLEHDDPCPSSTRESVSQHSALGSSLPGKARVDEGDQLTTGASCSVAERVQFFSSAATGAACERASSSRPVRKGKPYRFPLRERGSASSS